MKVFCETMALYVIPAIRAMVARNLMENHGMTQKEAAKKLGMTQPAVSQYRKHLRGFRARILEKDPEVNKRIAEISNSLAKNEINAEEAAPEICKICKYIKEKELIKILGEEYLEYMKKVPRWLPNPFKFLKRK